MVLAIVGLLVIAAVAVLTLMTERWGPSQATLERRYLRMTSRFVDVDGVRIHYVDEGPRSGIPVVFTSAQWACFTQWDAWVPVLSDKYRVIRIDLPGHGLTGPIPSGDYSFENYERLLVGVLDVIGLDTFALVGTSFGGTIAFRYAAKATDRLLALGLASASGLPRPPGAPPGKSPNEPPPQWLYRMMMPYYRLYGFMRWKLGALILNRELITPALVREFANMNNRRGRLREAQARGATYKVGDPAAVLAQVRVPVLIQWSTGSTYLTANEADRFAELLTAAPVVRKLIYPGTGHLIAIDAGAKAARDLRAFLDEVLPAQSA